MSKDFFIRATINRNPLTRIMVCWPYNETVLDESLEEVVYSMIEHYLPDYGTDAEQSVYTQYDLILNMDVNTISRKVIWSLAPHSNCTEPSPPFLNVNGKDVSYIQNPLYEEE